MQGLRDKVVLITGADGGIGRQAALRFAAEGSRVVVSDISEAGARETGELITTRGGIAVVECADLASAARKELVPKVIARWGRVDVLVNNATYRGALVPFMTFEEDDWEKVMAVNLTATAVLSRAAARDMLTRESGAIVNVTAVQPRLPLAHHAAYGASKGAVAALTRSLAAELSPHGIRVNAVEPGVVDTGPARDELSGQERPQVAALLGRWGSADEVAAAIAFLASDEASFITGAALVVDGGRSISRLPDPFEASFRGHKLEE